MNTKLINSQGRQIITLGELDVIGGSNFIGSAPDNRVQITGINNGTLFYGVVLITGTGFGSVSLQGNGAMTAVLDNDVDYSYFDFSFDTGIGGPIANCHGPIAKFGASDSVGGQCFVVADQSGSGSRLEIDGNQVVTVQQDAITGPTGGSVIDVEARASIDSILAAMRAHGLIAT